MSAQPKALVLRNVSCRYGEHLALDDVSFELSTSDFLGLVGPNGGGKTTLVKVILGMLKPFRGTVEVLGVEPKQVRSRIGYVPQFAAFDPAFPVTVEEAVLTGRLKRGRLGRRYTAQDREIVRQVMGDMGLLRKAQDTLQTLSGGERQRLLVARALATEPEMLILDEPTSSVDSRVEQNFYDQLRILNERIPVVLVSHDLGFISTLVTHVACLNRRLVINPVGEVHAEDIEALYDAPVRAWSHDCEL